MLDIILGALLTLGVESIIVLKLILKGKLTITDTKTNKKEFQHVHLNEDKSKCVEKFDAKKKIDELEKNKKQIYDHCGIEEE